MRARPRVEAVRRRTRADSGGPRSDRGRRPTASPPPGRGARRRCARHGSAALRPVSGRRSTRDPALRRHPGARTGWPCAPGAPPRSPGRRRSGHRGRFRLRFRAAGRPRCAERRLAAAGFAHQGEDLAFLEVEADVGHGAHRRHGLAQKTLAAAQQHRDIADAEQRHAHCMQRTSTPDRARPCGGGASRQAGRTSRQRGANRQPAGRDKGDGTMPGMPMNDVARSG